MHGGKKQLVKTRFFWVAAFLTSSVRPTHRTFESKLTTNCVLRRRAGALTARVVRRAVRESNAWTDESYVYLTTSAQRHVRRPSGERRSQVSQPAALDGIRRRQKRTSSSLLALALTQARSIIDSHSPAKTLERQPGASLIVFACQGAGKAAL